MRLSELAGKRIINLADGEIIGNAGESDLLIEPATGLIAEIIIPAGKSWGGNGRRQMNIPWSAVRKIGSEVIVVDFEE